MISSNAQSRALVLGMPDIMLRDQSTTLTHIPLSVSERSSNPLDLTIQCPAPSIALEFTSGFEDNVSPFPIERRHLRARKLGCGQISREMFPPSNSVGSKSVHTHGYK
jgi:hypothetical protein